MKFVLPLNKKEDRHPKYLNPTSKEIMRVKSTNLLISWTSIISQKKTNNFVHPLF